MRAVSVLFLVQGAAPGALTIVMPGGQPTAQEKEPESRGGGVELQGFCVYQCFGRAPGCNSVGFLGMLIRGCRGSPGWWGGALAPPAAQVCPGAVLPLLAPHLQKESPSTARKSRGEGSGEGRHRAILCTTGTDGKRLMR